MKPARRDHTWRATGPSTAGRAKRRTTARLLAAATVGALAAGIAPAAAYWQLWRPAAEAPSEPPSAPAGSTYNNLRDATCPSAGTQRIIYGDNVFIRGGALRADLAPGADRALAAAQMSSDPQTAADVLASLLAADDAFTQSAARMQLAWVLLKTVPDIGAVDGRVREALAGVTDPRFAVDVLYIQAVLAREAGDADAALAALDQAVALEPAFYNARILKILLELKTLRGHWSDGLACDAFINDLAAILEPLEIIGACPIHVAHLGEAIDRAVSPPLTASKPEFERIVAVALAYVSRQDRLHAALLAELARTPGQQCAAAVSNSVLGGTAGP